MREWKAPEKADLVISELLGSFSDNELSPECIDGVSKRCKNDTISVPCALTDYVIRVRLDNLSRLHFSRQQKKRFTEHHSFIFIVTSIQLLHNECPKQ